MKVVVIVPEMLTVSMVEQSEAVAVLQDEPEDDVDFRLDECSSLLLPFNSGSMTVGCG
jgi:DNA gyrase inhibitor GyrI